MTTKQALLKAIEQLPEQQLIEVLQYVQHLAHAESTLPSEPNPVSDPQNSSAQCPTAPLLPTDDELYGS